MLDSETETNIEEDGEVFSQRLTYNSQDDARSITIASPAHKDLQSLNLVMHAHKNGYWHNHAKVTNHKQNPD